jgi:hypothetical protein
MALDITDVDVYAGLVGFIQLIVPQAPWAYDGNEYPAVPILRGQQNRVPMPNVPCVIMTTLGAPRPIGTTKNSTEAVIVDGELEGFTAAVEADFEYAVQADFYSPLAESWSMAVELLWRNAIGFVAMPAGMKPLYSEGRQQLPLIGAENQWIQRWTMTLYLDYAPTWTQPTQAARAISVIPWPVDVLGIPAGFPTAGAGSPPAGSDAPPAGTA